LELVGRICFGYSVDAMSALDRTAADLTAYGNCLGLFTTCVAEV
jgi:hypothetical protein